MYMEATVSITSQRQIYIPAPMYQALNLHRFKKASIKLQQNRLIIEPIPDLLSLEGIFQDSAFKNKKIEEIMKLEEQAFAGAMKAKFKKKK